MNKRRKYQNVPAAIVDRCRDYGKRLVAHYASGGSPNSRAVSGDRGTESNPERLAQGKVGECATALYFRMNVDTAVKWNLVADDGTDIILPNGIRTDVKTTFPPFNLIWSRNVNHCYEDKKFDVIASVSIEERDFSNCWIEGYVSKKVFFENKKVADGVTGPKLEPGTWYMAKADLWDVSILEMNLAQVQNELRSYRPSASSEVRTDVDFLERRAILWGQLDKLMRA